MEYLIALTLSGAGMGMVYGLVGLGFVMIFKSTGIFNFAMGEMVMIGSFLAFTTMVQWSLPPLLGIILALIGGILVFYLTQLVFLRPMIGQPLFSVMIMTVALILFFHNLALGIWGAYPNSYPNFLPTQQISLFGNNIAWTTIIVIIAGILIFIGLNLFFKYSKYGLAMRSVCEDHQVSQALGVNLPNTFGLAWMIGGLVATVGGIILGTIMGAGLSVSNVLMKSFPAVVFGGLESFGGAIIGGLVIGILESWTAGYIDQSVGGGLREITPFIVMLIILLVKPYGLFGLKRIERI